MVFLPPFLSRRKEGRPDSSHHKLDELLHTPKSFQRILERERERADRTGRCFSLIHFSVTSDADALLRLGRALQDRLRLTDDIGWLSHGLAAVLPDTDSVGAATVALDVLRDTQLQDTLSFDVFRYPDQDQDSDQDADQGSDRADRQSASDSEQPEPETGRTAQGPPVIGTWETLDNQPIASLKTVFVRPLPWWKRGLDIVGAAGGLVFALPILSVAALAIRWTSPGPILFTQRRAGLAGRPFTIYKLRTMHVDAEAQKAALRAQSEQDGPAFKLRHDPRITRVGWYLRKTCIDELPQLWNVLRGDMTLVGPRPLPVDEAEGCQVWERRRLEVTPGLTCIWQVHGGMRVTFSEWMRMDIRYMRTRSFRHDIALLWQTFVKVLFHRASH